MKLRLVLIGLAFALAFMISAGATAQAPDACDAQVGSGDDVRCNIHSDGGATCCLWRSNGDFVGCCTVHIT